MSMTDYGRGYNAGVRGRWPEHRPPNPPHPIIANVVIAARELRDITDSWCARFSEDDEFVQELGPKIDALDEALVKISRWLKESSGS